MIVDAHIVDEWGHTYDAKEGLSWLLRILFISSMDLDFYEVKTGNQIFCGGWDGVTFSRRETTYIPQGKSIWELGTESDFRRKFRSDNTKRLTELEGEVANLSFCFATPFLWINYDQFENEINSNPNRRWHRVKIHSASTLANWLEEQPWVKSCFFKRLNRADEADHIHMLREEYRSCSMGLGMRTGILDDLIISGRNSIAEDLYRWIESDKEILMIQTISFNELRHVISVSVRRQAQEKWDYWGTKIIFIDDDCTRFNNRHLKCDNILVANSSQYNNLCEYRNQSGCRIIIASAQSELLMPEEHDEMMLDCMSNHITAQALENLNYSAEKISTILEQVNRDAYPSYDILRKILTGR